MYRTSRLYHTKCGILLDAMCTSDCRNYIYMEHFSTICECRRSYSSYHYYYVVVIVVVSNRDRILTEAQHTLRTLVENYQRATVDCTFADVPRELLETKNKQLLLEKAATSALFDKSASIETCKTTNRLVRDYLGVTGKGTGNVFPIE